MIINLPNSLRKNIHLKPSLAGLNYRRTIFEESPEVHDFAKEIESNQFLPRIWRINLKDE